MQHISPTCSKCTPPHTPPSGSPLKPAVEDKQTLQQLCGCLGNCATFPETPYPPQNYYTTYGTTTGPHFAQPDRGRWQRHQKRSHSITTHSLTEHGKPTTSHTYTKSAPKKAHSRS
ncbi:Hypothetical predicted protein [Pelobates cultripes]|uniref:Uncharacterized protein n=1 Tax=Pelobates cultripes TaxID=61616 RepID=A0AAD1RDR3_PELCU|nr:Hypothetical predicted protein [Pelobates cultripes]